MGRVSFVIWPKCLKQAIVFSFFSLFFLATSAYATVDLVINHTDSHDPIPAGGIVTYTISIANNGATTSPVSTLRVTVPAGATYIGHSSADGVTCSGQLGNELTCDFGSLAGDPVNQEKTVEIELKTQTRGPITVGAEVATSGAGGDSNPANNIDNELTTVVPGANVALEKTASAVSIPSGSELSYNLIITNAGPDPASLLQISDPIPSGFNLSSLPAGCSNNAGIIICDIAGSIASGGTTTIGPITGVVTSASVATITNSASVSVRSDAPVGTPQDPDTLNNTDTVDTTVTAGSDIKIIKSRSVGGSLLVGESFNFILSPSYSGDSPLNLTVTDPIPANYTIDTVAFQTSQNGWSCSLNGQDVNCTRASGGASAGYNQAIGDIIIPVTVALSGIGVINTATITTTTIDPDLSNNTTTDGGVNLFDPTVDLGINKTGPVPALVVVGVPFDFNVNVKNTGNSGFFGTVRVFDEIPDNLRVNSYTLNGWSCSPAAPVVGPATIICERVYTSASPLAAGATSPYIVMTSEIATDGIFINRAIIRTPDCNLATCNDGDLDTYTVISSLRVDSADIRLIKTVVGPDPVPAGDILTYTLEVVNDGQAQATSNDVRLTDTFRHLINNAVGVTEAGFIDAVLAAGVATGGTCSNRSAGSNARRMSCDFVTIPFCTAGINCPVVTVRIRPGGDGGVRNNTADIVSNGTADSDHINNSDSVSSRIDPRADVTPTKTVTPDPVPSGQNLTYVVTVRNNGPSRAANVVMTDTLPLNVTFISATPSSGTCVTTPGANITTIAGNRTVSCNLGSINNGAQQTVTIVVRPNNATRGMTIANDVSVITSTTETDGPANTINPNNTATVNAFVSNPSLDLTINKDDGVDPVATGDDTIYTIRVTNSGPSAAENVVVTDTLPGGTNLSFQSVTGVTCSAIPAVGSFGGILTCELGYLPAGSSMSFTVTMRGEAKGFVENIVSVTSTETGQGFEMIEANNSVTEHTTIRTKADMEVVSKVPSDIAVNINQGFDFTITIRNNSGVGLAEADEVEVSDNLPPGFQLTGTPTVIVRTGTASSTICTGVAGFSSFSCDLGTVSSGGVIEITAPVTATTAPVGASIPGGGIVTNTASVTTSSLDIDSNNDSNTGDVTVLKSAISGSVFRDLNDDGVQGGGESGISDVAISLTGYDIYGNTVNLTVQTNRHGNYLFDNLPPSNTEGYTITETQPAGFFDGQDSISGVVVANSKTTDKFSGIVLNSDTALSDYQFGELPPATLSGNIWHDINNNGAVDGGEAGIGGIDVRLTGIDDLGNAVDITVQTATNGTYSFTNLRPSDTSGYTITEPTQPAGHFDGLDVAGSLGGTVAADRITTIIVVAGDNGTGYNFAELLPATLSGSVFIDNDGDAVKDTGEISGVTGLTIQLTGTDDLGTAVFLTDTTGANGAYSFADLRPGTYTVTQVSTPSGLTHTGVQAGNNGGTIAGVVRTAGTGVTGEGLLEISAIIVGSGDAAANYNFGKSGQGLSGFVYVDLNNNGIKDAGEPGIPNVSVTLLGNTYSGIDICVAISPNPCTVVTDSSGAYAYIGLPASNSSGYTLHQQAQSAPPLSGYQDGIDTVGTLGGTAGNDVLSNIVIDLGMMGLGYNFGERGSSISGRVFHDVDDNGSFDGIDSGLGGVTITLSGTTRYNGVDICTVLPNCIFTTAVDGSYRIDGLPAGNYTIRENQPVDFASGITTAGTAGGMAADNIISNIYLGVAEAATGYLFAEKTGSLSGSVYHDSNNDGVMDGGENPIAGVTITLSGITASGIDVCTTLPSCTTTTADDGSYGFSNLRNANSSGYTITQTQPANYLDGIEAQGLVNGSSCSQCNNNIDNQISNILFYAANTYINFDFGEVLGTSVSGRVWHDIDADGIQDADESGLGQITLTLAGTDDLGNEVDITVTTAADGTYSFIDLRPSDAAAGYTVTQTQPAGINDFAGSSGTLPGSAGGVAGLNQITGIVLASGVQSTANNFREDASMFTGGSVYLDTNNNGVRDGGETGIAGVIITLNASVGGACADGSNSCSVVTDVNGDYLFAGLRAGSYDLIQTHSVIYQDGRETAGSQGGTVDNSSFTVDPAQNSITGIILPAGSQGSGYLFGERQGEVARISGQVWMNSNQHGGQGSFDAGDQPQEGWIVELLQGGTVIATTTTLADGTYEINIVAPGYNHEVRFRNPVNYQIWGYPVINGGVGTLNLNTGTIDGITIPTNGNITGLDLPIDPSGVIYNSITREPVAGAAVTLSGPPGFDPVLHLVGGSALQITGSDGLYQYLLNPSAPDGTYSLSVVGPAGYVPGMSVLIPPCVNRLTVDNTPDIARVQDESIAPDLSEPTHDIGSCPANTSAFEFVTGHTGTIYYASFLFTIPTSGELIQNHIPIDPVLGGAIALTKTTPLVNVSIGQLVPYTITATNTLAAALTNIDIRDILPPGFKYKSGSASLDGVLSPPVHNGRVLSWNNLSFPANGTRTIKLLLVVGAGVQPGKYINTVQAFNNLLPAPGNAVSNRATAAVRVIPDPVFDCSDVIGKVFDDRNANGYQDEGEPGIPNVRLATVRGLLITTDAEGRYHVTCAMVPNEFRGSNFIMKLDERTLPSGYRVTTENPRIIHLTRGKMGKLNFGAAIHRVVRLELSDAAFVADQNEPGAELYQAISGLLEQLRVAPSVIRLAYNQKGEPEDLIKSRLRVVRNQLETLWDEQGCCYTLIFEEEIFQRHLQNEGGNK